MTISKREPWLLYTMGALTLATASICLTIEILNARAGYFLPRELPKHGNPKWRWAPETERMWRSWMRPVPRSVADPGMRMGSRWPLPAQDKEFLEGLLRDQSQAFSPEEKDRLRILLAAHEEPSREDWRLLQNLMTLAPLTPAEQAAMERYRAQARSKNQLRAAVGSIGLLQYPLAPVAWMAAGIVLLMPLDRRYGALAVLCLGGASVSLALMLYRGYVQSLGW